MLPPSRSSPPPSPGPDWHERAEVGPRAARRAAVEAREPLIPRRIQAAPAPSPPAPVRRAIPARDARAPASRGPRRVAEPKSVRVNADEHGCPMTVAGKGVEAIRESWLIEDRWWTDAPLRRRYWEVVTAEGRNRVVFRDLEAGGWYAHRG